MITDSHYKTERHAFIVATHTDKAHIHNHIIFNSTNINCDRKFRDSWFIALVLQKVSDIVCLEHALSVINPDDFLNVITEILTTGYL